MISNSEISKPIYHKYSQFLDWIYGASANSTWLMLCFDREKERKSDRNGGS
jgi:hypothetical protein